MPASPPTLTRRDFLRTSAAGALAALLAGCTPLLTTPPASSPTSRPRVLRINMPLNRGDVGAAADPGCSGAYHSYLVNSLMFSALVYLDEGLQPTSDLAASWQPSDDGVVWRFTLRPDLRWSDGQSITAHDFEWAVKRNLAPDLYCGGQYWQLVDLRVARPQPATHSGVLRNQPACAKGTLFWDMQAD
jgi:oligopeptide transport system substrate-binding protein